MADHRAKRTLNKNGEVRDNGHDGDPAKSPHEGNGVDQGASFEKHGVGGSNPSLRTRHSSDQFDRTNIFSATHAPEHVTRHMCRMVGLAPYHRVLEPSAGVGRMAAVIAEFTRDITAVELNKDAFAKLADWWEYDSPILNKDFLTLTPEVNLPLFSRIIMCPPARSDEHIRHATKFLRPGGKLAALVQEQNIDMGLWPTYHRIRESFAHSGVTLPCGIITLQRRTSDD